MSSIGLFCRSLLQVFFGCIRSLLSEWVLVVEVAGENLCVWLQNRFSIWEGLADPRRTYIYIYMVRISIYICRKGTYIYICGGIHKHIYILFAVSCSVYAVCCSVLQYVAPGYWDTLNSLFDVTQVVTMQSVAVCCSLLQSVAACGSVTSGLLNVSQVMTRRMYD